MAERGGKGSHGALAEQMSGSRPDPPIVALVTGGSRGIGAEIATALAKEGYPVAVNYVNNANAAMDVVSTIRDLGGVACVVQGDVGSRADAERIIDDATNQLGPVLILVNNAGVHVGAPILKFNPEAWMESVRVNLNGPFFMTRYALPAMYNAGWGRVIAIGSPAVRLPFPGDGAYTATKAGVTGMMSCLAREAGTSGITANVVIPGWVETDMTREIATHVREKLLRSTAVITGREVADLVCYLCSDAARSITGEAIAIRGAK